MNGIENTESYILDLYNQGYCEQRIAWHIGWSENQVRAVINHFKKLGAEVRSERADYRKLNPLPYKWDEEEPHYTERATIIDNIKTPKIVIDGEVYTDVTEILSNSYEIAAMGYKAVYK